MTPLIIPPRPPGIIRPAPKRIVPPFYFAAPGAGRCLSCPFPYKRVYAWGGNFESSGGGLYPNDKTSFIALYNAAIAQVNSIDMATVPLGYVRWFNYGGVTSTKADNTFIDSGNVVNNPTNLPGDSRQNAPCGTGDYGAIVSGGSIPSYIAAGGNPAVAGGVNAGGYQQAAWIISAPHLGAPMIGFFGISRIQVNLSAQTCGTKWCSVQWFPFGTYIPGSRNVNYFISCDTDNTVSPPGSGNTCENASVTQNAVCIDIPTSFPVGWGETQPDPTLPAYSRYFIPGANCADIAALT